MYKHKPFQRFIVHPMILFSSILLIKAVITWFAVFENGPSWTIVLKEMSVVLMTFILIEWLASKRKLMYYWLANLIFTCIFFAVIMYYKYYGVIVTYHALAQVNQVGTVKTSVFSLLDPYYMFIFADIIVLLLFFLIRKHSYRRWSAFTTVKLNRKSLAISFTVCLMISVSLIMPHRSSLNEIVKAEQMGILNYELYTVFAEAEPKLVKAEQITQSSIFKLKGIEPIENPMYWQAAKGKHLILIQMESLQNFVINLRVGGKEITPVLNDLAEAHAYFSHFYQQVGQGNTSDAEYVVNTSSFIPSRGAATQVYAHKELPGLPKLLEAAGYQTATFHTNDVEFWNRDELYNALGFHHIYDKDYFGDEDVMFFGASDEVLYRETAAALDKLADDGRPIYAHVIAMSAHHPYTLPEDKRLIDLPTRYDDTLVGDYLVAQHYADYALGLFIEDLKERGLWNDSLIIIYGDHLGLPINSLDQDDHQLLEEIFGREYTHKDMINIPLIMISDGIPSGVHQQLGGQVDILPTAANLLGISLDDQIYFGQDLLNHTTYNLLPQRYYLPSGSFLNSEELFMSGAGFEDGEHYPLSGDGDGSSETTEEEFERALTLLHLSDSYIQQLPDKA